MQFIILQRCFLASLRILTPEFCGKANNEPSPISPWKVYGIGVTICSHFWMNIPLCGVLPHLSFCLRSSLFTEAQPGTGKLSDLQGDQA
jgi:hypothetical protein